ncbi:MAG: flavodoxin-dependent (E)-4-hydroxy-3-methylbut-2-enyl-diphosphate synthase, partial [Candidatus Omnitrophica bacterium]|nr:flavodoxin-dependent (E)-4-hydroxy-3-methylbut-2-enyl-diphosphate synthase [Candidatus Omnitrophota bacterium]
MAKKLRRQTPTVNVGPLRIGSDHPVAVQSMTDTPTADVEATFRQTVQLIEAGSELVRWTINDDAAASGAVEIISRLRSHGIGTPIVGDFHFNGHVLLTRNPELAVALDKYRINPGNVGRGLGKDENFAQIISIAIKHGKVVRIGVNWGSLDRDILAGIMEANQRAAVLQDTREVMFGAVLESALASCRYALELGLPREKLVVSAKMSVVQDTIEVNERLSSQCDYVMHLGLTEAGGGVRGIAASAAALAVLLEQGIGDTVRVSLTPQPGAPRAREVEVARELLQSMGFRYFLPAVTSCPGCGRTESVYFRQLAQDIQDYVAVRMKEWGKTRPGVEKLSVAVMGCVVNGPGESRHADIGISLPGALEEPVAPVYIEGKQVATL